MISEYFVAANDAAYSICPFRLVIGLLRHLERGGPRRRNAAHCLEVQHGRRKGDAARPPQENANGTVAFRENRFVFS